MQWRILNDQRPLLQVGADKLASKEYARQIVEEHGLANLVKIPATYWVGTDLAELRALEGKLPARWVLKPNHTSGRFIIVDSTERLVDWGEVRRVASRWINPDEQEYMLGHQLYIRARHLLFAEERVGDGPQPPHDLRVFGFAGDHRPPNIYELQCNIGSHTEASTTFRYDKDFVRKRSVHAADGRAEESSLLDEMPQGARETLKRFGSLALQPFDHVRVDLYYERGLFWFGELAVYPASGLSAFSTDVDRGAAWTLADLAAPDPHEAEWRALLEGTPMGILQNNV
jgi:hypothetical protein